MLKVYNMKKNSLLTISCFIFFLFVATSYAQKVSNVNYRQEQSSIIVSYDLETKAPCKVSLYVSTNGGTSWQGPLTKMTGDIGNKIGSGSHNITWNVLEEFEELRGDKIKFQVRAKSDNIETVKIGAQEWTTKNLNVNKYRNGDIIPEVKDLKKWDSLTSGAWCYYDNDPKNGATYGKLYNWYAVNDPRGLAPEGYHIPNVLEINNLIKYLGGLLVAGGKMKELGLDHWNSPNIVESESSGFMALPGYQRHGRNENWVNDYIGATGFWWLSSEYDDLKAYEFSIRNYVAFIYTSDHRKSSGLSVRCIKD